MTTCKNSKDGFVQRGPGAEEVRNIFSQLSDEDCRIILDCAFSLKKRQDSLQSPYQQDQAEA